MSPVFLVKALIRKSEILTVMMELLEESIWFGKEISLSKMLPMNSPCILSCPEHHFYSLNMQDFI